MTRPLSTAEQSMLDRLRKDGPIPFDHDADPPAMTSLNPTRDTLMALVRLKLAEMDYGDRGADQQWVVHAKREERMVIETTVGGYEITPAILALRARRLGR